MSFSVVLQGSGIPQTVRPSVAQRLVYVQQPGGASDGVIFSTQPVLHVQDNSGVRISSATNLVTFTASPGTLGGTLTLNAVAGIVSPTDLKITGAGTDTLTATASGLTSAISEAFTVGSGSTDPVPSGTIWFDTRAGGAQDLQAVTTLAAAQAFFNDGSPNLGSCCFFTTNYDGAGTHALRFEWVFTDNVPHDYTREIAKHLTDNTVTDLYVQYKSWLGRTATGGGIGTIGSFIQANPAVSTANRKAFRNVIETGGGGCTDVYNGSVPFGGRISDGFGGDNNYASGWDNSTFVGQIIVSTFRVKVGSAGHLEVWKSVGGTQLVHYDSGANKNVSGLWHHAFQFPSTMNTPAQDQSDYYWDIVAWTP